MYTRCIVDELGTIRHYTRDMNAEEEREILENYPEWRIECVLVEWE